MKKTIKKSLKSKQRRSRKSLRGGGVSTDGMLPEEKEEEEDKNKDSQPPKQPLSNVDTSYDYTEAANQECIERLQEKGYTVDKSKPSPWNPFSRS